METIVCDQASTSLSTSEADLRRQEAEMEITFPPVEYSVQRTGCVTFPAVMDGAHLTCRIAFSALMELPDAQRRHHLTTFRVHRPAIQSRAVEMIYEGRLINRELMILADDFRSPAAPSAAR